MKTCKGSRKRSSFLLARPLRGGGVKAGKTEKLFLKLEEKKILKIREGVNKALVATFFCGFPK